MPDSDLGGQVTGPPDLPPSVAPRQNMVKYGELIVLGYNGQLPQGLSYY